MIRHIYDLPYDQMLEQTTVNDKDDDSAAYSTNEDLLFHIAVFTAADKYDIASLRPLVVRKFESLMETNWEGESFAASIQRLVGPSAGHLADNTLQAAAAAFCAKHLPRLVKKDDFVKMIHEMEPFTGRLLTGFLKDKQVLEGRVPAGAVTIQLKVCKKSRCLVAAPSEISTDRITSYCIMCGVGNNHPVRNAKGVEVSGLVDYEKMFLL